MNLFKKTVVCAVFALMVLPKTGFSQYLHTVKPFFSYFGDLKQYDLGFTYVMPFAKFEGVVPAYDGFGKYRGDTTAKRSTPGMGIGGSIGLSVPFKATGHISCWAFGIHVMGHLYTWKDLNKSFAPDGSYKVVTPSLNATTIQIAVPMGIEYKAGNEVIQSRRLAFGTTIGVGVMPNFNLTTLANVDSVKSHGAFGFNPYFKFELGFLLGIDMKIRVMYTMGDVTLIDVNRAPDYKINGPFKVTSNANLMVSLVLMPFSGGWHERKWYNTYDTYNKHDRLN